MVNLDYQSRTPIYEQIINEIERYVSLGILKPNEQLPSIRDLASTLGINPNTVKKAYSELENRGIIITISTKGTFITQNITTIINNKFEEKIQDIKNIISELEKMGHTKKEILKKLES